MTPHALIVDDEAAIRMVARLGLERVAGWSVSEASGADEALAAITERRPDVVLLDVMMPGQDGPQTLEHLRALPGGAQLAVVFLTAKAMRAEVERLRALGVDGVIAKPFDPMTLAAEVSEVLGWASV
ncbi:MAG TPA: response regulator [Egicoccus sp.]|nr:response regulator [Egicoccus sp.]HSK22230.1 response regulator [Egicoccus sp.]